MKYGKKEVIYPVRHEGLLTNFQVYESGACELFKYTYFSQHDVDTNRDYLNCNSIFRDPEKYSDEGRGDDDYFNNEIYDSQALTEDETSLLDRRNRPIRD